MATVELGRTNLLPKTDKQLANGSFFKALNEFVEELETLKSALLPDEWASFTRYELPQHSVWQLVKYGALSGQFRQRCSTGAPDAAIMDFLYGHHGLPYDIHPLTRAMFSWECALPGLKSLANRRILIGSLLDELCGMMDDARILAVGCGSLRELEFAPSLRQSERVEIVAIDDDPVGLATLKARYPKRNLQTIEASAMDLDQLLSLGKFDFIYANNALDSLKEEDAQRLLGALACLLEPGSEAVLGNFTPEMRGSAYFEACLNWPLHLRTKEGMSALAGGAGAGAYLGHSVFFDATAESVFLQLQT